MATFDPDAPPDIDGAPAVIAITKQVRGSWGIATWGMATDTDQLQMLDALAVAVANILHDVKPRYHATVLNEFAEAARLYAAAGPKHIRYRQAWPVDLEPN